MTLVRHICLLVAVFASIATASGQTPGTFKINKADAEESHVLIGNWCLSIIKITGESEQHFDCDSTSVHWTFTDDGFYLVKTDSVTETGQWKCKTWGDEETLILENRRIVEEKSGNISTPPDYQHRINGLTKKRFILQEWEGDQGKFFYYSKI